MTIDLHDLTLPDLPEWGSDVPGTPVEVIYTDGTLGLCYAWRDGLSNIASAGREHRNGPVFPWDQVHITAVLADDPAHWVPVDADEREELGDHLAGARVCCERGGANIFGPVAEVDEDGWLWAKEGKEAFLLAAPYHSLRVHPADLAAAREAEGPPTGSVVLDSNGRSWQRDAAGWRCADGGPRTWVVLNDRSGPLTVIHRAEP